MGAAANHNVYYIASAVGEESSTSTRNTPRALLTGLGRPHGTEDNAATVVPLRVTTPAFLVLGERPYLSSMLVGTLASIVVGDDPVKGHV